LKIAFVLNSISGGGIARVVTTYANELVKVNDLEIYLILLHKKSLFYLIDKRINVIENPFLRTKLLKYTYSLKSFFFLRKTFKENQFDRIISNGEWINSFVYFASLGIRKKLFFADHSNPLRPKQTPFPLIENYTYKKVDGILVLSKTAFNKVLNNIGQKNVFIIENPVNLLNPLKVEKENIIICLGRLSPEKGQDVLLRAFAITENKEWKLQFIGDGEFKTQLEKDAKYLGISDRVEFLGNQQDIEYYLSKATIFVMPSHTENFPMALIEAMSIGLPCLVTDCMPWRGDEDFIKDGLNGIKVPVNDPEALAEGLIKLINSEELRTVFSRESLKIRLDFNLSKNVTDYRSALKI